MILQDILFIVLGLVGLFFGGDNLVRGAARLAASFNVSPLIIGLTIVAFGTSAPELIVNISAALEGSTELSLGNVLGSNVANIGLILGVSGVIAPITVAAHLVRREIPILIGISLVFFVLALNGNISRVDGVLLVIGLVVFNIIFLQLAMQGEDESPQVADIEVEVPKTAAFRRKEVIRFLFGAAVLIVGGQLMVTGATNLATDLGVSQLVIGVTLVAFGTSLPELAASIIAAVNKQTDILVGNIIGSNIYNILAVLGITAIVEPVPVTDDALLIQFPVMIVYTFLLLPFALDRVFERWEAGLFLGGYAVFIVATVAFF
jgi:cation:H+ antiporter